MFLSVLNALLFRDLISSSSSGYGRQKSWRQERKEKRKQKKMLAELQERLEREARQEREMLSQMTAAERQEYHRQQMIKKIRGFDEALASFERQNHR